MRNRRRKDKDGRTRLPILADFASVETFVAIMETRSVSKAASRLNAAPSAVSQRLAHLEQLAEIKLFNRTTRSVSPTEAAFNLYNRCREIMKCIDVAEQELWGADTHLSGELRIAAPVFFGMYTIAPILPEFVREYPDLHVIIQLSTTENNLVSEGFDLAIRLQGDNALGHDEQILFKNDRVFCASPGYLKANGLPQLPSDLESHECVASNTTASSIHWPYKSGDAVGSVRIFPVLQSDNVMVLAEAARQGLGIAMLGRRAALKWLSSGELVTVLDDFAPPPTYLVAATPDAHYMPKKAKVFVEFMLRKLSEEDVAIPAKGLQNIDDL